MLWSARQGLFCLIGSTAATLILFFSGYAVWRDWRRERLLQERYQITAIIQTGPEKEALKTSYLAELLSLSADLRLSLYAFDHKEAERRLCACPLIASATVRRMPPNAVYVDYTVRKPIAWLADYQNIGLDRNGYLFPMAPFFSPKQLPEIYLGLPPFGKEADGQGREGGEWQTPLQNKHLQLAFEILDALESAPWVEGMRLIRIDVSNAFAPSYGQREIVLFTEEELLMREQEREIVCVFPKILRIATKGYAKQLSNFLTLRRQMFEDYERQVASLHFSASPMRFAPRIIDLRIEQCAFVQNQPS